MNFFSTCHFLVWLLFLSDSIIWLCCCDFRAFRDRNQNCFFSLDKFFDHQDNRVHEPMMTEDEKHAFPFSRQIPTLSYYVNMFQASKKQHKTLLSVNINYLHTLLLSLFFTYWCNIFCYLLIPSPCSVFRQRHIYYRSCY